MKTRPNLPAATIVGGVLALVVLVGLPSLAERIKNQESASHGSEAAWHQVKDTFKYPGFRVVQFELAVRSHYSYPLVSGKEALVVDPGRTGTYQVR